MERDRSSAECLAAKAERDIEQCGKIGTHNKEKDFMGNFCPPGSGSNPDPDPKHW